jgi:16S rRNA processing protein RimM
MHGGAEPAGYGGAKSAGYGGGSLAVGVVTATHGIGGEIKVKSLSGENDHLLVLREASFRKGREEKLLAFESVRPQAQGVIVKVRGFDVPEVARRLIGYELWVPRGQAARRGSDEYYASDLCGCTLWFGQEEIGVVRSVWDGGPSQLLEVHAKGGKTFLVPFTDHFIGEVEVEKRRIFLKEDEIVR